MKKILRSNYHIIKEKELIIEVIEGIITPGSLIAFKKAEIYDKNFVSTYNVIGDIRNSTFDITTSQIEAFVNFLIMNKPMFANNKHAIVFSSINQQVYINILKSHEHNFPQSLKICTSIEEAAEWVDKKEEVKQIEEYIQYIKKDLSIKFVYESEF